MVSASFVGAQSGATRVYLPVVAHPLPSTNVAPGTIGIGSFSLFYMPSNLTIAGEVVNNRSTPVYNVTIDIQYFDNANRLVYRQRSFSYLNKLNPEQRAPFGFIIGDAVPGVVRAEASIESFSTSSETTYMPLTIVSQQVRTASGIEVVGQIRNDQAQMFFGTKVVATFYDANGKVVNVQRAFPNEWLDPGETAAYSISIPYSFPFARYTVQGEGNYN